MHFITSVRVNSDLSTRFNYLNKKIDNILRMSLDSFRGATTRLISHATNEVGLEPILLAA